MCVSWLEGSRKSCCSRASLFWLLQNPRAFSAKELASQHKIAADSIVTAAVFLSMFPEKHAGCDLSFSGALLDGAGRVCSDALIACTGLQKQGRKLHKAGCHMSEAVKKQQLVLGHWGWQQN